MLHGAAAECSTPRRREVLQLRSPIEKTEVFRVRIDQELEKAIAKRRAKWRKTHPWQRSGDFYRRIIALGLEADESNPNQTTAVRRIPRTRKSAS